MLYASLSSHQGLVVKVPSMADNYQCQIISVEGSDSGWNDRSPQGFHPFHPLLLWNRRDWIIKAIGKWVYIPLGGRICRLAEKVAALLR